MVAMDDKYNMSTTSVGVWISLSFLFFLNFVLYAVGGTYDDDGGTYNDLSEAGSIFGVSKHFILYHWHNISNNL